MYKVARELRLCDKITRAPGQSVADFFQAPGGEVAEVVGLGLVAGSKHVMVSITVKVAADGLVWEREIEADPADVFTLAKDA